MHRKPIALCGMHWAINWPRPSAKSGALVIDEGLTKARFVIHHERTLLHDWLSNWATLKHEAISTARGVKGCGIGRAKHRTGVAFQMRIADLDAIAIEDIERSNRLS
jgi:hypothetical protein